MRRFVAGIGNRLLAIADRILFGDFSQIPNYWVFDQDPYNTDRRFGVPYISENLTDIRLCGTCAHPIYKALTSKSKPTVVDAGPNPEGTLKLRVHPDGVHAEYVPLAQREKYAGQLYVSHFASCPDANEWRENRRRS